MLTTYHGRYVYTYRAADGLYSVCFTRDQTLQAIAALGHWAASGELGFTWLDAARVAPLLRAFGEGVGAADDAFHRGRK